MRILIALLLTTLSTTLGALPLKNSCPIFNKAVASGPPALKLKHFLDAQWKYNMTEYPEWATYVGYAGQNDRWSDQSLSAIERRKVESRCLLSALKKVPRQSLTLRDRLNYDLAARDLEMSVESDLYSVELLPVNHMSGVQNDSTDVFASMPAVTQADFKNVLARLDKLPLSIQQSEDLMREGIKRGIVGSKQFLPRISAEIDSLLPSKIEDSPLYRPFVDMGTSLSAEEQTALRAQARLVIEKKVYPAFQELKNFVNTEYTAHARDSVGWSELPKGKEWYAFLVKFHTTTKATPDELHELGLREVDRLAAEMTKIKEQVKFKGDIKAFNKFLLTDKQFYFDKPEELLTAYRDIAKRIDPELTKMFKTLPRLTYGVREMPPFRATSGPGAEYQGGSLEAGRPGWFQANTYDLKSRPKWDMETLTFHEGVPGHHLQIAVAQEIGGDMPEFRKFGGNTAYAEGWALYAESLGSEMGFYKDPYSLYGHYSDEMLRAVRLVVDTGIHAKGWSREKALDYYRSKMPVSDIESENEINRYCVWPGQALAYKVGQLKFRELRDRANKELGDNFDVREFHDVVLGQGSLPMDVLEKVVDEWVTARKKNKAAVKSKVEKV